MTLSLTDNNQTVTDPKEKAEILHKTLANPLPPKLKTKHINFQKIISHKTKNIKIRQTKPNYNDVLNINIKKYEIENCIRELSKDKACGPDKIHNQMLINGGPKLYDQLTEFNNVYPMQFPNLWNYANIHPIPKPNKTHNIPKNYRPIAVSSCLGRVFEKVLAKRLQSFCIQHKIFNNNQCGFQINRCTDDILSVFLDDVYKAFDKKTDVDCVFTDFSKAYDSIWHDGNSTK